MNPVNSATLICAVLASLLCGPVPRAAESGPAYTVFVDINIVHPNNGRVDRNQTVVVSGPKIVAVGSSAELKPPATARTIKADGAFLVPGLAEMHAHVPHQPNTDEYVQDVLFLWAANGVTTIRGMNGEPSHLELRGRLQRQEITGPRLITAGPPFIGKKIKTAEEASRLVVEQHEAGYDFIKVHMGISRPVYDAVAKTSRELGMPFAGHVTAAAGLERALSAGQLTIDHLDAYWPALVRDDADVNDVDYGLLGAPLTPYIDDEKLRQVAETTREAGVWNVPTLSMAEKFVRPVDADDPALGLKYMPPRMVAGWISAANGFQKSLDTDLVTEFLEYRKRFVKALHDAGAGLLLGADAPQILNVPGFSIHRELQLYIEAGLTPGEALTTGTVSPARFLDKEDTMGRIAEGFDADLILVAQNPLENIVVLRAPMGVMLRGEWISAADIQSRLEVIADKYTNL